VIVKLLADQMHGRVEVASEPGHGARFTLHLRKARRSRVGTAGISIVSNLIARSRIQ
jgi:hypothetical protein